MPKFLNTRQAIAEIHDIIKNANDKLIIISPYLKISSDFQELLQYRDGKTKKTTIIFREQDLQQGAVSFLKSLRHVVLLANKSVHAKCYLSDEKIVITSLNLYNFSMANNKEMGVLLERSNESDRIAFDEAMGEALYLGELSTVYSVNYHARSENEFVPSITSLMRVQEDQWNGYCIRTGIKIPFNLDRPMTYEAFMSWDQYRNRDYPEKYCHYSGELSNGETSFGRPVLNKNWRKAQEKFGF